MVAVRIEEKNLLFHFELGDCTFNVSGTYYAKLSIQCGTEETQDLLKQVQVWSGDGEDLPLEGVSMVTNTVDVTESNKDQPHKFTDNKITFRLPKGLCSPANAYQITLLAEVFPYTENDLEGNANIGQSIFTIYPRTSTPFLKLHGISEDDDLYNYQGTLNLRKTLSEGGLAVLGGRLNYLLSLKVEPEPEPEPEIPPESPPLQVPSPAPQEPEPEPEPTPVPEPEVVRSPPILRPRTTSIPTKNPVSDDARQPRRDFNPRRGADLLRENHVSRPGKEDVIVIVHAATNLPCMPDGSTPRAYVAGTSDTPYTETKPGICTTHSGQSASINPTWEEAIRITVPLNGKEEESRKQTMNYVMLQIINETTRTIILEYKLPVYHLQPFHVYHLDLVQNESHLFISVLRRQPLLMRLDDNLLQSHNALNFRGLEVLLLGVEEQLANPVGPLVAAARLIPDLFTYRQQTAQRNLQALNVLPITVEYPDPHPSSFLLPSGSVKSNHPQVSLVGQPEDQPTWRHAFLFTQPRELASLFTDIAALTLQFYPATSAFAGGVWTLHTPIGYCAQLLDTRVYHALRSDRGMMGIRVSLPLQGSDLKTRDGKSPRVAIILRIITSMAMDDDDLPSHNAMRDLLPPSKHRSTPPKHLDKSLIPTRLPPTSPDPYRHKGGQPKKPNSAPLENYDKYSLSLMDSQQKEIANYRDALGRMGEEIVRMQEHIGSLEGDNGQLRQRINMYEDAAKAMSTNDDLDNITKAELLEKYVVVRQKLARQVSETANYRDKLLQLQNDMIKQNDREKTYLNQQESDSARSSVLQDNKQSKIKKLENTCREQEKALEKMEQLLMSKRPKNVKQEDTKRNEVDLVAAENERLKAQIEQIRTESANKASRNNEGEKLMLQMQLEKAKSRVQSLERELTEKAREWGKQKESARLRMGEQHQSYNQRALPPLRDRDRGYNQHSDDEMDRGFKGMHQQSPHISNPFY